MSARTKALTKAKRTSSSKSSRRNKMVALAVALVVATAGYTFINSSASGFFVSVDPSTTTPSGNASVVTESDGTRSLQFNATAPESSSSAQ